MNMWREEIHRFHDSMMEYKIINEDENYILYKWTANYKEILVCLVVKYLDKAFVFTSDDVEPKEDKNTVWVRDMFVSSGNSTWISCWTKIGLCSFDIDEVDLDYVMDNIMVMMI